MDDIVLTLGGSQEKDEEKDNVFLEDRKILKEKLFSGPSSRSQIQLSTNLAALHSDLTMPIFSGFNIFFWIEF